MATDWTVEIRLIKPDRSEAGAWRKALDQLSANELYQELLAQLKAKVSGFATMIPHSSVTECPKRKRRSCR
jgi:hypothetical protein